MKRLWFAFIFIVLCVLACAYEQYVVKSAYEDIVYTINAAIVAESDEEKAEYCLEIAEEWSDYYKKIALISEHSILENTDIAIRQLNEIDDGSGLDELLKQMKSELEYIYENSRINLSNIF